MRERRSEPPHVAGGEREGAQPRDQDEVDGEEDEGRPFELPRNRHQEEDRREHQPHGEAVEHSLHDHGGDGGPEALTPPRHHVRAQDLARAQGEEIVTHVADHHRVEEVGRPGAGREEKPPTMRAAPEREEVEGEAEGEEAPPRLGQARGDRADVGITEEVVEQDGADGETEGDLEEAPARRRPRRLAQASTRIMVVGLATTGSLSMAVSAARMSRSRASCVIITIGTASWRSARRFCSTETMEIPCWPRWPATWASVPGRSSAITRR